MLRVKDVEKIIDRDRNTILRWEREGKIPHPQKDSRGWRYYTESDIQVILSYLKNNNPYYSINMAEHSRINNPAI
ncbi:MAG: MerR family transcriptional regulator [Parcubacteria group bacterium]|jgi:DNA-binding transcriptional MerR regulator